MIDSLQKTMAQMLAKIPTSTAHKPAEAGLKAFHASAKPIMEYVKFVMEVEQVAQQRSTRRRAIEVLQAEIAERVKKLEALNKDLQAVEAELANATKAKTSALPTAKSASNKLISAVKEIEAESKKNPKDSALKDLAASTLAFDGNASKALKY